MAAADEREDNLTDKALESEIELVGDLVVAATSSDGPMPQSEVDEVLGVKPPVAPEPAAADDLEPSDEEPVAHADK